MQFSIYKQTTRYVTRCGEQVEPHSCLLPRRLPYKNTKSGTNRFEMSDYVSQRGERKRITSLTALICRSLQVEEGQGEGSPLTIVRRLQVVGCSKSAEPASH